MMSDKESKSPSSKVRLRVVYEDPDVIVMMAPNEEELKNILLDLLRDKPMTVKELHSILSGIASEDKIRRALSSLSEQGQVMILPDGRYRIIGV